MIDISKRLALDSNETAEVVGVSLPTLYALLKREHDPLPSFRIGRKIVVPVSTLIDWMERQTREETA